jgi:hypothetical protein
VVGAMGAPPEGAVGAAEVKVRGGGGGEAR